MEVSIMADQKEIKKALHCQLDKETYDELVKYCEKSGQSKTVAIRRAIKAYCENKKTTGKND
jgi:predicted DNA-binding protein